LRLFGYSLLSVETSAGHRIHAAWPLDCLCERIHASTSSKLVRFVPITLVATGKPSAGSCLKRCSVMMLTPKCTAVFLSLAQRAGFSAAAIGDASSEILGTVTLLRSSRYALMVSVSYF
jgi:hypothetical protein